MDKAIHTYLKEYGRCDVDEINKDIEVIAWQPLPQSYTESEVENDRCTKDL